MRLYLKESSHHFFSFLVTSSAMVAVAFACLLQIIPMAPAFSASLLAVEPFSVATDADAELKFIGDYRKDLKAFLKRSKLKDDPVERVGAIVDLCMLHHEIVNDPRFDENYQLQGFRAVAGERLKRCRKEIEVEIKRLQRREAGVAKKVKRPSRQSGDRQESSGGDEEYLKDRLIDQHQLNQWMVMDMQAITQISGGPISLWSHIGGNHGPGVCDYGPDLVRLIETTINSDFWRRNGGTGIIEYYQPLRILVVSASAQVHDQMTDLLETLRLNGR